MAMVVIAVIDLSLLSCSSIMDCSGGSVRLCWSGVVHVLGHCICPVSLWNYIYYH